MTQGYVFVFRPTLGTGMIVTDSGEEVSFVAEDAGLALEGGDIVQLELASEGRADASPKASRIHIIEKGSNRLAGSCQGLLRELHSVMELGPPGR